MDINRETFKRLPPEDQSLALFDGLSSMPKAVADELSERFVPKAECVHRNPPAQSESWLTPKTILAGLIGLGTLAGVAVKELRGGDEAPPVTRPAISAPAQPTTGGQP